MSRYRVDVTAFILAIIDTEPTPPVDPFMPGVIAAWPGVCRPPRVVHDPLVFALAKNRAQWLCDRLNRLNELERIT